MSEKVLYRKYRPSKLSEVIGQDHVVKTLKNSIQNNSLRQAYLLCGNRGCGKTSLARIIALMINCENGPSADYDVNSRICSSIINGTCPDVEELDAASNSSIEQIRDIRSSAYNNPVMCRKKIIIIDEAHILTTKSASVFLKTLEEPPPNVVFILATTESHKILDTIKSRCTRFDLKKIPSKVLAAHLKEICTKEGVEKIEDDALNLIARAGSGSVRDSLSILDSVLSTSSKEVSVKVVEELLSYTSLSFFTELFDNILTGNNLNSIIHLKKAQAIGKDPMEIFNGMLEYIHDIMLSKVLNNISFLYIEPSIKDQWLKQRDTTEIEKFQEIYKILESYISESSQKMRLDLTLDVCIIELLTLFKK